MKKRKKRIPWITIGAITLIIIAIIYLESQKLSRDTAPAESLVEDGDYALAPEFVNIEHWINTEPLTMEQLKGKVVLIDIWTYSCVNCIRTLPYIKAWHQNYADDGLIIIGVHTPEFAFERQLENVQAAVDKYEITYPVAMDNNYGTWRAYNNKYWPRKFLVDIHGKIRYDHIGEGGYEETEHMIKQLLEEKAVSEGKKITLESSTVEAQSPNHRYVQTPEIYFGSKFYRGNIGNTNWLTNEIVDYSFSPQILPNTAYLEGQWKTTNDYSELLSDAGKVLLRYGAKEVNIVAGSDQSTTLRVLVNDELHSLGEANEGILTVNKERIYTIVNSEGYEEKILLMDDIEKGFKLFTFTFG